MERSLSLFAIEENLAALLDTAEMVEEEDEDARLTILADIGETHEAALRKRDNVIRLLRRLKYLIGNGTTKGVVDQEIADLRKLKGHLESRRERIARYIMGIIQRFGRDGKRLDGTVGTLTLARNPESTDITDETAVPSEYKTLTITVPATAWEEHIRTHEWFSGERAAILDQITRTEVQIDRTAVKAAIKAGTEVPGGDLKLGEYRLEVK